MYTQFLAFCLIHLGAIKGVQIELGLIRLILGTWRKMGGPGRPGQKLESTMS